MKEFKGLELPIFGPDERQGFFFRAVDKLREEFDDTQVNNLTYGWEAAHVNMGWIQDTVKALMLKGEIESVTDVQDLVFQVVQRPKQCNVVREELSEGRYRFVIKLVTKDDFGYYDYGFQVYIDPERLREKGH